MQSPTEELLTSYQMLKDGQRFVELDRTLIRVSGDDRHSFLHNFCTNEIKKLESGNSCEAFFLNTKGKILGHGFLLALDDAILITAHGRDQAATLIEHMDRYIIREDVTLTDLTPTMSSLFICESETGAKELGSGFGVAVPTANQHVVKHWDEGSVEAPTYIAHLEISGPGWLVMLPDEEMEQCVNILDNCGIFTGDDAALEMIRVENQTPLFGVDFSEEHLPQELARDKEAISFVKGCYLGQETVARIDALGQVNKEIRLIEFSPDAPVSVGSELKAPEGTEAKPVGIVTSCSWSPQHERFIGLAMVKRKWLENLDALIW